MLNNIKAGGREGRNDWLLILGLKKNVPGLRMRCTDDLSDKVTNIMRRHTDKMKLLLIYSLHSIFYQCIYNCIPV